MSSEQNEVQENLESQSVEDAQTAVEEQAEIQ